MISEYKQWNKEIERIVVIANDIESHCSMLFLNHWDIFRIILKDEGLMPSLITISKCIVKILSDIANSENSDKWDKKDALNFISDVENNLYECELPNVIYEIAVAFGDDILPLINV